MLLNDPAVAYLFELPSDQSKHDDPENVPSDFVPEYQAWDELSFSTSALNKLESILPSQRSAAQLSAIFQPCLL